MTHSEGLILIYESDSALQNALRSYLDSTYQVQFASTGQDMIQIALQERPRMILSDIRLPDISALEMLQKLKTYPRTTYIPLILFASGTDIFLKAQFLEAGVYDFLTKPLDYAELALRIRNGLGDMLQTGDIHPRTRLPMGKAVGELIKKQVLYFCRINVRIVGFTDFEDHYGFLAAAEVISFATAVMCNGLEQWGLPEDFVGHADDHAEFVIVVRYCPPMVDYLKEHLEPALPQFYNFTDRDQGYVQVGDGTKPLMSLEIEVL